LLANWKVAAHCVPRVRSHHRRQPRRRRPSLPLDLHRGIDPELWIPIPGVQTLNFKPYRVNLTPFASLLDDGQPHTIALSVFNADSYFSATATLLLYLDSVPRWLAEPSPATRLPCPLPTSPQISTPRPTETSRAPSTQFWPQLPDLRIRQHLPWHRHYNRRPEYQLLQPAVFKIQPALDEQNVKQTPPSIPWLPPRINPEPPSTRQPHLAAHPRLRLCRELRRLLYANYLDQPVLRERSGAASQRAAHLLQPGQEPRDSDRHVVYQSEGYITGNANQSSAQSYFASDSKGYCYSKTLKAAPTS